MDEQEQLRKDIQHITRKISSIAEEAGMYRGTLNLFILGRKELGFKDYMKLKNYMDGLKDEKENN